MNMTANDCFNDLVKAGVLAGCDNPLRAMRVYVRLWAKQNGGHYPSLIQDVTALIGAC